MLCSSMLAVTVGAKFSWGRHKGRIPLDAGCNLVPRKGCRQRQLAQLSLCLEQQVDLQFSGK